MFELAQRLDLTLESLQEAHFLGQLGGEDFDGGLASAQLFLGEIDVPHAAAAKLAKQDPIAQSIADHVVVPSRERRSGRKRRRDLINLLRIQYLIIAFEERGNGSL